MIQIHRIWLVLPTSCLACLAATTTAAAPVEWTVKPALSSLTLSSPDIAIDLDNISAARIRNQGTSSTVDDPWSSGNSASMSGTIHTEYVDGGSVEFLSNPIGQWVGVDSGTYRPNPASFNPADTNASNPDGQYQDEGSSPAVFAGRSYVRTGVIANVVAGNFSLDTVSYDATSAGLPLAGDPNTVQSFDAGGLTFGILASTLNIQGDLAGVFGQLMADEHAPLGALLAANAAAPATIENLGGVKRRMTIPIDLDLVLELGGIYQLGGDPEQSRPFLFATNVTGTIVATANIPEPATIVPAACGLMVLAGRALRRKRR